MDNVKDYLVTGITGFAGPHLAKLILDQGHNVHGLVRGSNGREYELLDVLSSEEIGKIKFHHGDLKDHQAIRRIFEENHFDGVFHLGAQAHPPTGFINPVGTMQDNVMGTVNLVDNIQRAQPDCILQNTSTSEVYGNEGKDVGVLREDLALKPNNPYGTSKAMAELYVRERSKNGFLKGFSTRGFSHTGVRRGKNFSISWDAYHLALLKKGVPITDIVPVDGKEHDPLKSLPVGNLGTQRIVIDVKDCMRAYLELMQGYDETMSGESYNVCGSMENVRYMEHFTDALIDASGLEGIVKVPDKRVFRPIDIQMQVGDATKLYDRTGWKPEIDLEKETLPALLNYWENKLK
jgi:GDP-4-dehydro-6-deoxy-D-mannose reductase